MLDLNKVTPDELRSLLGEPTVEQSDEHQTPYCNPMRPDVCVSAYHTNWLFEAQNSELLQSLFHNHTASFTFTRGMLPLEYYSVGYCIAHSHSKWSLTFDGDTEEEELHMLVSGAKTGGGDYRVAVKTTSMTPEKMHILMTGFSSHVEELYYLKIPDNDNSLSLPPLSTLHIMELQVDNNKSAFNISYDLPFSSLEALMISSSCEGTTLGAKTCNAIAKLLSSTTSLKKFFLSPKIRNHAFSAHVSNNGMEVITKGLSDNIALPLKSLDIDCKCTFTTTATRSLAQFIIRSTTLQCLNIHIDTFENVAIFAEGLSDNIALPLESLDIDCKCTFTTTVTRSLVKFITRSTTLQCLSIHIDTFEDVDIFAKGLSGNIALPLESLDIDCKCTFTTTVTRSLVKFITRSTTLQCLSIHIDTFEDVDIFAKGLSGNIVLPLKSLDIDCKCTFTTTATRSLVQFITRSTTLQYIRICHVTFSAQGLIELTEAIRHCSRLQEKKLEELTFRVECSENVVNLRHMIKDHPYMLKRITDWDGVTNLQSFSIRLNIKSKASITRLGLGCSQDKSLSLVGMSISDGVAVALAQALHHNSTLEWQELCNNNISDAGAVALAQALHHNSTLEWLDLSNNNISDAGAVALAQALHHNSTLERLYLFGNDAIGKEGTHQLVQALTVNTSITKYSLILPRRCKRYTTQCTQYNTVKDKIHFV